MIYEAKQLKTKLNHLTLAGVNDDGDLEFIGTTNDWDIAISDHDCHGEDCQACYELGNYEHD